jgi:hypothetical protein
VCRVVETEACSFVLLRTVQRDQCCQVSAIAVNDVGEFKTNAVRPHTPTPTKKILRCLSSALILAPPHSPQYIFDAKSIYKKNWCMRSAIKEEGGDHKI